MITYFPVIGAWSPHYIPLSWQAVASVLVEAFSFLNNTIFVCGDYYFSLWDIVVWQVMTFGVGTILYTFITGGFYHD